MASPRPALPLGSDTAVELGLVLVRVDVRVEPQQNRGDPLPGLVGHGLEEIFGEFRLPPIRDGPSDASRNVVAQLRITQREDLQGGIAGRLPGPRDEGSLHQLPAVFLGGERPRPPQRISGIVPRRGGDELLGRPLS